VTTYSLIDDPCLSIEPHPTLGQLCLRTKMVFGAGTVLVRYDQSRRVATASRYTVQRGEAEHLELDPTHLRYINHSCQPNVFFDVERMSLVALKPIAAAEELAFFYPSTEWSMAEPFTCACGAEQCLGRIAGAAWLARSVLAKYRLSRYIQTKSGLTATETLPVGTAGGA
jgi:hypothetical protein